PPGATPPIEVGACRVTGSIKPTSDSDIRFELWMPLSGWNGKFLSAGEGGYAGTINYGGIRGALLRGYAGGSTDTGHVGGNADFALGHPEKVTDFGWRGKHLQAARPKDLVRAFYGEPASLSCPAGTDGGSCLTPPQVAAVKKIMASPRNPRTGEQIYPGYFTSAAGEAASWPAWITGPATPGASIQAFFGNSFFARIVN